MKLFRSRTTSANTRQKADIRQNQDPTGTAKPSAKRDVADLYRRPTIWL